MITFIVAAPHTYTVAALRQGVLAPLAPETRAITYDDLFASDELARGTYVFTDMERLHPSELRLAAQFFRYLGQAPGVRVLNNPARVRTRFALLRALHESGLNDFDAYRADSLPRPCRFPVFLRISADHNPPLGDLIHGQTQLEARLEALVADGIPLEALLVIEFCGAPRSHGHYEKLAFFKVGERIHLSGILLGDHWNVKNGRFDLMTPEILTEQLAAIRANAHVDQIRAAFDVAGLDYGRADVGIVNERLQVYEINTNPSIKATTDYVSPLHEEARRIPRERFGAMLHAIDLPATGEMVRLDLGELDPTSRYRRSLARRLRKRKRFAESVSRQLTALRRSAARLARRGLGAFRGNPMHRL